MFLISFIASIFLIFLGIKLMGIEKIIKQILSSRPELSKEKVLERLEKERRKTNGLIADEVLLRMIAADLNVKIPSKSSIPLLSLVDLVPGLNDVTVVGRVVAVFSSKTFAGNKSGKVASVFIVDKESILRVVLWNDKANFVESGMVKTGQIIRFSHGYTREGSDGKVELHIGDKGKIEVNPEGVDEKDYPTISNFRTKISDITQTYKNRKINLIGVVERKFPVFTFKRKNLSSGKVMRLVLADETGRVPVIVWNEKVDVLEEMLKQSTNLQVVNAKVKKARDGGLEVHVNTNTYVRTFTPAEEFLKIADLKEGLTHVNIKGEVTTKPMLREVRTSKGEIIKLATLELKDETGRIWLSAWRKHADSVKGFQVGDKIIIKNAYVKRGFGENLELQIRNTTAITLA